MTERQPSKVEPASLPATPGQWAAGVGLSILALMLCFLLTIAIMLNPSGAMLVGTVLMGISAVGVVGWTFWRNPTPTVSEFFWPEGCKKNPWEIGQALGWLVGAAMALIIAWGHGLPTAGSQYEVLGLTKAAVAHVAGARVVEGTLTPVFRRRGGDRICLTMDGVTHCSDFFSNKESKTLVGQVGYGYLLPGVGLTTLTTKIDDAAVLTLEDKKVLIQGELRLLGWLMALVALCLALAVREQVRLGKRRPEAGVSAEENRGPTSDATPSQPGRMAGLTHWYGERFGAKALEMNLARTRMSAALFWLGVVFVGLSAVCAPVVMSYTKAAAKWAQADKQPETKVIGMLRRYAGGHYIQKDNGEAVYPVEGPADTKGRYKEDVTPVDPSGYRHPNSWAGTPGYGHLQEGKLISIYTARGSSLYKAGEASRGLWSTFVWVFGVMGLGLVALALLRQKYSPVERPARRAGAQELR